MKNFLKNATLLGCGMLVFLANISTSTSTLCLWHEPDCPEELLKK